VVLDPYDDAIGLALPKLSAEIVTVSHDHADHNAANKVKGTSKRDVPFVITESGEYEIGRISVFGAKTYHDDEKGAKRGTNIVYTVLVDGLRICHLGDLGHDLTADQLDEIGTIDILLCPVGGEYTIGPEQAVKTIRSLEPSIVVPMHYRTPEHDQQRFAQLKTLEDFLKVYGVEPVPVPKIDLDRSQLPDETEMIVLRTT
jgi:L-ascorbate metabolism protein UlaG (beta-lactamase superfamily)